MILTDRELQHLVRFCLDCAAREAEGRNYQEAARMDRRAKEFSDLLKNGDPVYVSEGGAGMNDQDHISDAGKMVNQRGCDP